MAVTIKLKNASGSDPSASDLVVGEVAIRTDNGKLFTKKDDGSVAEISGSGGGGSASFSINTLSSSSATGGGSATFNGSAYRFTLSSAPATAAQLLVSIEGVIQKPNSGTSQPSEGFALDGDDIIFAAAPASGASFFIVSTVLSASLVTPADNTVTSAKIVDGAIVNADINASAAIAMSKLALSITNSEINASADIANSKLADSGVSAGTYGSATAIPTLAINAKGIVTSVSTNSINTNLVADTSPQLGGDLDVQGRKITSSTTNASINLEPNGNGVVAVRGAGGYDGTLQLNCSANSHGIKLKSPPHSAGQSYTLTFPSSIVTNGALLTDANGDLSFAKISTGNIENDSVDATKLINFPTQTILGRETAGTGNATTLSASQVRSIINVENGATADQTDAEIKTAYENNSNTNAFTDALLSKLNGIESNATADQSNSEIKTAYEANSNTNAFTDALLSKLNGIAASATNVTNNNQLTNGAGYITSAALVGANNGGNAALLDGIDSAQFLRSDQDDSTTGILSLESNSQYPLVIDGNHNGKMALKGSNDPYIAFFESTTRKAYVQWDDAGYLALVNEESGEILKIKSGSNGLTFTDGGSEKTVWHSGNDGASSGLDADVLDGQQGSYYLDYNNLTNVPSVSSFPSGTKMFFQQSSAPTGWTKDTSNNNNSALRVVTGNVSSGGSNNFTTSFNSSFSTSGGSVSNHTLTTAQMPSHRHKVDTYNEFGNQFGNWTTQGGYRQAHANGTRRPPYTSYEGSGNAHNHGFSNPSLNLNVKYVDVIMCSKN